MKRTPDPKYDGIDAELSLFVQAVCLHRTKWNKISAYDFFEELHDIYEKHRPQIIKAVRAANSKAGLETK